MVTTGQAIVILLILVGALFAFGFIGTGLFGDAEAQTVPAKFRFIFPSCPLGAIGAPVNVTVNGVVFNKVIEDFAFEGLTDNLVSLDTFVVPTFGLSTVRLQIDVFNVNEENSFRPPDRLGFSNVTMTQSCT